MSDGIVSTIVDRVVRDRAARWLGRAGVRLPTFAELADPSRIPETLRSALRSVAPDSPEPANLFRAALVQRPHPDQLCRDPFASRIPALVDGGALADPDGARLLLPVDRRAQGAGGIWMPDPPPSDRPVRPGASQSGLAIDRELLSRRHRDLAHSRLPRYRRAARGHERGALRLAAQPGRRGPRISSGPPARRATSKRSMTNAPSSRAIRTM